MARIREDTIARELESILAIVRTVAVGAGRDVIATALELLLSLNDGSAARYGLRPSEFVEWRRSVRNIPSTEDADTTLGKC